MGLEELGGWPAVLGRLMARQDLTGDQAAAALSDILVGAATPAQVAAFVTALRIKGETVEEMAGLVRAINLLVVSITALVLVIAAGQVLLIYVCWQYVRRGRFPLLRVPPTNRTAT